MSNNQPTVGSTFYKTRDTGNCYFLVVTHDQSSRFTPAFLLCGKNLLDVRSRRIRLLIGQEQPPQPVTCVNLSELLLYNQDIVPGTIPPETDIYLGMWDPELLLEAYANESAVNAVINLLQNMDTERHVFRAF